MKRSLRLAVGLALLAGCTASHGSAPPAGSREPLQEPYVVLSSPQTGLLIWPSGANWLLLATDDGFRHVIARTPPAVDTGGGLAVARDGSHVAAAIGPVERLVRSPLVVADASWGWQPAELPGAVADARRSVAVGADATYAVLRDGRLIASSGGRPTTRATAAQLARGGGFEPDTVSSDGPDGVVVTGHGSAGTAMAYRSSDGGRSWRPLAGTAGTSVAALAPCPTSSASTVPVLSGSGQLRLVSSGRGASGAAVQVGSGTVTLGCAGTTVLLVDAAGRVEASTDSGQHWSTRGRAPAGLTDIEPTAGGAGFAVSGGAQPRLWRFTGNGARFVPMPLPAWVAQLGAGSGGGD